MRNKNLSNSKLIIMDNRKVMLRHVKINQPLGVTMMTNTKLMFDEKKSTITVQFTDTKGFFISVGFSKEGYEVMKERFFESMNIGN